MHNDHYLNQFIFQQAKPLFSIACEYAKVAGTAMNALGELIHQPQVSLRRLSMTESLVTDKMLQDFIERIEPSF